MLTRLISRRVGLAIRSARGFSVGEEARYNTVLFENLNHVKRELRNICTGVSENELKIFVPYLQGQRKEIEFSIESKSTFVNLAKKIKDLSQIDDEDSL